MKIANQLDQSARRFAAKAQRDGLGELADIEVQAPASGASGDTPGWTVFLSNWPCSLRPTKEGQGMRQNITGGNAPSLVYDIMGPAVTVKGAQVTAITVTKEMRLKVKPRGAQLQRTFTIIDIAVVGGIELKILASLPD
jgi:hypothetical protein